MKNLKYKKDALMEESEEPPIKFDFFPYSKKKENLLTWTNYLYEP